MLSPAVLTATPPRAPIARQETLAAWLSVGMTRPRWLVPVRAFARGFIPSVVFLIGACILTTLSAFADDTANCVVPTSSVTSSVSIRKSPSASSALLGKMVPGNTLSLLDDVPNWYQVELADQSGAGYVSKRWTETTACDSASNAPSASTPPSTSSTPSAPTSSPSSTITSVALDDPAPLLSDNHPVTWWFTFKFNTKWFEGCGNTGPQTSCLFGGAVQSYPKGKSQQFVVASSEQPTLQKGGGCVGATLDDPVGATYNQIYNGDYHYVVWNDQFYFAPKLDCSDSKGNCDAPWGHSKGILAWNDQGTGVVMQVSTPSWPASGSSAHRRVGDGNTLGCVKDDDVLVSQHFFALKLNELDVRRVLLALQNASVVTDPTNAQLVNNGGPQDLSDLVETLGTKSTNTKATLEVLSSGITLISKPSLLHVPTWQFVSSQLHGAPLRAATWWATPPSPLMPSTKADTKIKCWDKNLSQAGAVEIATSGQWNGTTFALKGGLGSDSNHAKIGVSTDGSDLAIFGDENQQGTLSGSNCASSQNGRGGLFFVVPNHELASSVASLISGSSAPP